MNKEQYLLYLASYEGAMTPRLIDFSRPLIRRAARSNSTDEAAARAAGVSTLCFRHLCRVYGIPTPEELEQQTQQYLRAHPPKPRRERVASKRRRSVS